MTLFWHLTVLSFQRAFAYRAAALSAMATNLFFGFLRAAVLVALYGARAEVNGLTLQGAITYTGLSQAVIGYLMIFGWYDLMMNVTSGDIAADLLKPMRLFTFWMAQDLGRAVALLVLRGLPIMAVYALVFDISVPSSGWQWLALLVAVVLSWLVSFAWHFLVNLAAFWSPDARGIGRMAFLLPLALSGFVMPLRLYPQWFQTLATLTPFPAMMNTVVEIYLGTISGPALLAALANQALWALILVGASEVVLRAGVRRLVIQGG